MTTLLSRGVQQVLSPELVPARLRWWFAAEDLRGWYDALRRGLAPNVGGDAAARAALARLSAAVFRRRYDLLRTMLPALPRRARDPRAVGLMFSGLYRVGSNAGAGWIFAEVGGAPEGFWDHVRSERLVAVVPASQRGDEVVAHLAELQSALAGSAPVLGLALALAPAEVRAFAAPRVMRA